MANLVDRNQIASGGFDICSAALTTLLILVLTSGTQADIGFGPRPDIKLETLEADNETGQVTLKATVEV